MEGRLGRQAFDRKTATYGATALPGYDQQRPYLGNTSNVVDITQRARGRKYPEGEEGFSRKEGIIVDLQGVRRLQQQWDRDIPPTEEENKPGKFRNYNPVLARWKWEQLTTNEEREPFKRNELQNIMTASRERDHASESKVKLILDRDKKIRSELLPDEPLEDVLLRGYHYRASHGSKETDREGWEVVGHKTFQKEATAKDAKVGDTWIFVSPRGIVKGTGYPDNYVNTITLKEDKVTKEKYFEYVRFASPLGYDAYHTIALQLDPDYFKKKKAAEKELGKKIPTDAWYVGNPFRVSGDGDAVFAKYFEKDSKAMEEAEFKKREQIYLPHALYLVEQITKQDFDPMSIATAYNTLLSSAENKKLREQSLRIVTNRTSLDANARSVVAALVKKYGREQVQTRQVGCGSSGSYSFAEGGIFSNSVGKFGMTDTLGSREFPCPACGKINIRPINGLLSNCKHCRSEKVACQPEEKNPKIELQKAA